MLITLITINYNNNLGLEQTIKSVLGQKSREFDFLVIDGGSTDGSVDVIKKHNDDITYWVSEKDAGIYNAMNKGIAKVTDGYVIFLNSGDSFFDDQVIANCHSRLMQSPDRDVYYGDMFIVGKNGQAGHIYEHPKALSLTFFKKSTINHQASLIRRQLFDEFGYYPEYLKLASDYWLYIRSLLADKVFVHLDFCMVYYDVSGVSAKDDFKEYKLEQRQIWDALVPSHANQLTQENDLLELEVAKYRHLTNYKIVKLAISLNRYLQKIRNKIKML